MSMPEGPFGLPRFTSLGPFVEEVDQDITAKELSLRSHSIRNYKPEEFRVAADNSGKKEASKELGVVESGRFKPMLKRSHRFFIALDKDEMEMWARNNPLLIRWMNVWAFLEDQRQFREFEF